MPQKKKILVVDDDDDVIITYRVVLDRMGYDVLTAYDGVECLEQIRDSRPDLILLDVRLPGLSGTKVCSLIKEKASTSDIPVVAITSIISTTIKEVMEEVGADEFLLKPIDASSLSWVIDKFLGD